MTSFGLKMEKDKKGLLSTMRGRMGEPFGGLEQSRACTVGSK
jgi:hypothetical protein